jgi:hypothetical protein
MLRIINGITAMMYVQKNNETTHSIWNLCKDITFHHQDIRNLMLIMKENETGEGINQLKLYIAFDNKYFKNALNLYLSFGFQYNPNQHDYSTIAICMECLLPNQVNLSKQESETLVYETLYKIKEYQPYEYYKIEM